MTPTSFDVRDRVAIVTGASSGLGEQFARCLHAAGARVVLGARRGDRLDALVAALGGGIAVPGDVRDAADRARLVDAAVSAYGRVDILVNNAGVAHSGPALAESLDEIRDSLETNLVAAFALCQLVKPVMTPAGSIVNISSLAWSRSVDRYGLASYAASKAGLVALTRELAAQWGRDGIRVNSIAPAFFPSDMSGWLQDPDQVAWIHGHNALRRTPRRDELDGTLLYLASDASTYVTGQTINVDGGWSVY